MIIIKKVLIATAVILFAVVGLTLFLTNSGNRVFTEYNEFEYAKNPEAREDALEDILTMYQEFIEGKRSVEHEGYVINRDDIFEPQEEISEYNLYALFDMNGDGIPELHVRSMRMYYILTCRNNELEVWHEFTGYFKPLNNRAVLYMRPGGGPPHIDYIYLVLDYDGNEVLSISFTKGDVNSDEIYDETDDYLFEGILVTKQDWDTLTEKYLSVGSDEIEWINYTEGNH